MSNETPELPDWLADQVDAFARDEATAVAATWQRIEQHVPAPVLALLPVDVLFGTGPELGAVRFIDVDSGGTVVELRYRPDDDLVTMMRFGEVVAWKDGAVVGRMELPRTPPPADPSAN